MTCSQLSVRGYSFYFTLGSKPVSILSLCNPWIPLVTIEELLQNDMLSVSDYSFYFTLGSKPVSILSLCNLWFPLVTINELLQNDMLSVTILSILP